MPKFIIKELDYSSYDAKCPDGYGLIIDYQLEDANGGVVAVGTYEISVSSHLCHRTNGAPIDGQFLETWNSNLIFSLFKQVSFQWKYFGNLPSNGTKFTYTPMDVKEYPESWKMAVLDMPEH